MTHYSSNNYRFTVNITGGLPPGKSTSIQYILFLSFLYLVPGPVTSLQVRPSTIIFGLIITWEPPSGSNYPTPVTYRLRYRERPYNGTLYSWSSTIYMSTYQRQYTTPVLKPGTRYEVEVWAVSSIGRGPSVTRTATTYQCM